MDIRHGVSERCRPVEVGIRRKDHILTDHDHVTASRCSKREGQRVTQCAIRICVIGKQRRNRDRLRAVLDDCKAAVVHSHRCIVQDCGNGHRSAAVE